jgi:prephenate dehydrogenase
LVNLREIKGRSKMRIAVVDGKGGGIGKALIEKIRAEFPTIEIIALGTNSRATENMYKAGATDGASGENAIVVNAKEVDIIVGPIAILSANSMLGELTPKMAEAIGSSKAYKVLIPLNRCNIDVVSVAGKSLTEHIENAVIVIRDRIDSQK